MGNWRVKIDTMSNLVTRLKHAFTSGTQELEVAAIYLLLTVMLHLSGVTNDPLPGAQAFVPWWPVPLLLGVSAIAWRRRNLAWSVSLQLLSAMALLFLGSLGGFFLVFEAVFSIFLLAAESIRKIASRVIAFILIGSGLAQWILTEDFQQGLLTVFLTGFILLTAQQWATNVRHGAELARSEQERANAVERAAADREQLLRSQHRESMAEERTALAREMHDVLSARFSSIALLSGALLDRDPSTEAAGYSDISRRSLQTIRSESVSGLEEMTQMVRMLHSRNSSALVATFASIDPLVQSFRDGGSKIRFSNELVPEQLTDPRLVTALYRTLNEVLVNHAKHACAQPLEVSIGLHTGQASAEDGRAPLQLVRLYAANPCEPETLSQLSSAGTGISNIAARAKTLGGWIEQEHDANQFSLSVNLPLQVCAEAHAPEAATEEEQG